MTAAVDHTIAEDDQPAPITLTGVIDTVKTERVGSALSADAASGAGSVFVDDTGDFDGENGGTLSLGGVQYPYVAVNDSTGEITLSGTLTAAASNGDFASVWDVAAGEAAQDIVCLIALPGKQAQDDFMYATASPGVADKLALGQREPGQGESVRIISYDGGLEWEVISVRGKLPHIQPDALPATTPTTGGGPIGALQQGEIAVHTTGYVLDPFTTLDTVDDTSAMSYVSASDPTNPEPGTPGIRVEAGWYLVYGFIQVQQPTTNPVAVRITSPSAFGSRNQGFMPGGVDETTGGELSTETAYHFTAPALIAVDIFNDGGETVNYGWVTVIKLA